MPGLRKASTLILAASDVMNDAVKILSLKRNSTSTHFPDAYVFPGGNYDAADYARDWLAVLPPETHNVPMNITGPKSESSNYKGDQILETISARITAIRETFEETGLLLCQYTVDEWNPRVKHLELSDASTWRNKVRNNAYEFINLCRANKCFPNIKGLYLLNNWITPPQLKRRYDCKFFIAVMDKLVEGGPDCNEISAVEWNSMKYFLESEHIFLPPPQFYELMMLTKFQNTDAVVQYAQKINPLNCVPMIPTLVNAYDGMIFIFPGDEMYEKLLNEPLEDVNETNYSMRSYRGSIMHRVEVDNEKRKLIIQNFIPRHYNLDSTLINDPVSKL